MKFFKEYWETVDDFILEALRVITAVVVSYLATEEVLARLFIHVAIDPELKMSIVAGLALVLKALDRYLHEKGWAKKGLFRF